MVKHTIHIKNMVCDRCIRVIREELEALEYTVLDIHLGHCVFTTDKPVDWDAVRRGLSSNGFELLEDESLQIINKVKSTIIDYIQNGDLEEDRQSLSDLLTSTIPRDYSSLSRLFSSVEGITIEKFYIRQKLERVKELLIYDQLTLSEIAYRLGYSSVQHLSNQFKKMIGLSPTDFKALRFPNRVALDKVTPHES
ncbi:MAG: AraC family transcriptional regulator [FCB group bacterium]|nr:AraC family transcriptional regulator [FCB group bacterium]